MSAAVIWLIIAVALFVIEMATYQMLCIWFSFGALLAIIPGGLGAPVWVQLLVFLLASVAFLLFVRPIVRERITPRKAATNADRVIGQVGVVKETVDNIQQTGRVHANGLLWTARSTDDRVVIPEGSRVLAVHIDGVKLIVQPIEIYENSGKGVE